MVYAVQNYKVYFGLYPSSVTTVKNLVRFFLSVVFMMLYGSSILPPVDGLVDNSLVIIPESNVKGGKKVKLSL
jgi:hypothetical protein